MSFISDVIDAKGRKISRTPLIAEEFRTYFTSLYNLDKSAGPAGDPAGISDMAEYLHRADMPSLPPTLSEAMDAPLTVEELHRVLAEVPKGKAPGPDGLSLKYYHIFRDLLSPHLVASLNSITGTQGFPMDSLRAHIALIPKPGKDSTLCANYRPISLLNIDLKLFTKILANRIADTLPDLIHEDQVGFVKGREAKDNTTKVLDVIAASRERGIPLMLLSTDAEKAFDRVNWSFMFQVLRAVGFGNRLMDWIGSIYSNPSAQIKVNGLLSSPFVISNGTRQGCPLSPILFVLVLEPFLRIIRAHPDISGMHTEGSWEFRVAAFADDLLFFITKPIVTIPNLMKELQIYGGLSNFRINYNKSAALDISLPDNTLKALNASFPFRWSGEAIQYLGVQIPSKLDRLFSLNFIPLLTRVKKDLENWMHRPFSWFGRSAILKMNVLPKFLYLFQALPIIVPKQYLRSVVRTFSRFLWLEKPPRIKYSTLSMPKESGGIALPDVIKYYTACHLARVVEWCKPVKRKMWVFLEQQSTVIPLESLPWCTSDIPNSIKNHITIGATWRVCLQREGLGAVSPVPSPMFPVLANPAFPPSLTDPVYQRLRLFDKFRTYSWIKDQDWLKGNLLESIIPSGPLRAWRLMQLSHYLSSLPDPSGFQRPLTVFEEECRKGEALSHAVSWAYSLLNQPDLGFRLPSLTKWEDDLQISLTEADVQKLLFHVFRSSENVRSQESGYKLLTRWYRTPAVLHVQNKEIPDTCWRCGSSGGNILHIFWSCPKLQQFWQQIHTVLQSLVEWQIPYTPAFYLLQHNTIPRYRFRRSIIPHLLCAARRAITRLWRQDRSPSITEWMSLAGEIERMQDLLAVKRGTEERHCTIWSSWKDHIRRIAEEGRE